jgi:hypothetical protein
VRKTDEEHLEMDEVRKSLEMLLPERSTHLAGALLAFMDTMTAGPASLFFRSGSVNAPIPEWARSGSLVVLDFSPLPEPQQVAARMAVYLYASFLARLGRASSRVYIDEMEQVCYEGLNTQPVNIEKFAQWFALGNLPMIAGVGRVSRVHESFRELFDAAVCLQVRNKVDLRATADIIGMGDDAESGLYSSQRKSSYQLEFVQQLRPGWAVVKRSDRPEPFPIVIDTSLIARLEPLSPSNDGASASAPLKGHPPPVPGSDVPPTNSKTMIEHDLGDLAGFAAESLDFLLATAAAQELNGGPVSHKLLADQLLYKLQPALFRFHLGEHATKDLRDRIMDALAAADYLRSTYRKVATGKETSAVTYEVTPKRTEAWADANAHAGPLLKQKLAKVEGNLAGVAFEDDDEAGGAQLPPAGMNATPEVTPGALEDSFTTVFLPGLASARVSFLNDRFAEAAQRAEAVFTLFLARALGREVVNMPHFDRDALAQTLCAFPEWPFDEIETKILWDEFKPGQWANLSPDALDRKLNEFTAFHESYQIRSNPQARVPPPATPSV